MEGWSCAAIITTVGGRCSPSGGASIVSIGEVERRRRGRLSDHQLLQIRRGATLLSLGNASDSLQSEDMEAGLGRTNARGSGNWRPKPDGSIEVVIAQSTGLVEIQKGSYDAQNRTVTLQSELVGNALKVKEITRVFSVVDSELSYMVQLATHLNDLQPHLKALLRKV